MSFLASLLAPSLLLSACAFDPSSFDTTCATAADCAVVALPATCASCGDPWSIRADDVARWDAERPDGAPVCIATSLKPCRDLSESTVPTCDDGVCAFEFVNDR